MNDRQALHPMLKLALDLGPLLLFFFANAKPALFEPWIAPLIPAAVATGERGLGVGKEEQQQRPEIERELEHGIEFRFFIHGCV